MKRVDLNLVEQERRGGIEIADWVIESMIHELRLLRRLEHAVRADKIGCLYVERKIGPLGWPERSFVSTRDALKALEEME